MAKGGGWIKLHRSILENPIWKGEPFTKAQAWVDLLLSVDKDTGSLTTSYRLLAERWGWGRKQKVEKYLNYLISQGMITVRRDGIETIKGTRSGTVISLTNWGKFQSRQTVTGTVSGTQGTIPSYYRQENKKGGRMPPRFARTPDRGKPSNEEVQERYRALMEELEKEEREQEAKQNDENGNR